MSTPKTDKRTEASGVQKMTPSEAFVETMVANGVTDIDDPLYVPEQRREYSYEINYGVQATKWLMVRPNLQYVKYPGGLTQTTGAVVGGVQFIADF